MTTLTAPNKKTSFKPNANQVAILCALEARELAEAKDVLASPGVRVHSTSIYASLRTLKDRGLVIEKQIHRGATAKGDRFNYRLSAKGKKFIAQL